MNCDILSWIDNQSVNEKSQCDKRNQKNDVSENSENLSTFHPVHFERTKLESQAQCTLISSAFKITSNLQNF